MAADNTPDVHGHGHTEVDSVDHPHEKPEDWGWHHEFSTGRQIGGWMTVLVLGLYLTGWHYNHTGTVTLIVLMIVLAAALLWDRKRQRTQWRR